jgi:hypothetical protein
MSTGFGGGVFIELGGHIFFLSKVPIDSEKGGCDLDCDSKSRGLSTA